MPAAGTENRLKSYKNKGRDQEDLRRRRNEVSVELRKLKKEEQILKRRNVSDLVTSPLQERNQNTIQAVVLDMPEIIKGINSEDSHTVFMAVQSVRKMLSKEASPPIEEVIDAGVVPKLVEYLEAVDRPELQFEASWALTNVASGTSEQTRLVVKYNAVLPFIKLLSSDQLNVCEQAVWALGNIAGDGPDLRDYVITLGIVDPLLELTNPEKNLPDSFLRNVTWTLSNLCRNKNPPPPFDTVKRCLPTLARLIDHEDKEVLSDACWALSYLTDGTNEKIQEVVNHGVVPRLIQLLGIEEVSVVTPALRAVGNIVTGNDKQTQCVIDNHALMQFHRLLQHPKNSIQKEAAWTISNITAGNVDQIQAVVNAELIPLVVRILQFGDFKAQKEAVWVVTNLTSGGSLSQMVHLVQCGVLKPLCDLLLCKDSKSNQDAKTTLVILDAIGNIMKASTMNGEGDTVARLIEEVGGLDKIEHLQTHNNEHVYKAALDLIVKYFADDEEVVSEDIQPDVDQITGTFQFTGQTSIPTGGFDI